MTQRFVLDAWALLALLLKEEPAAARVRQLLEDANHGGLELFLSVINLGEVYYSVGRSKGETEATQTCDEIRALPLTVLPATDDRVFAAARLKMQHRIAYADAFAAASSRELAAVLVTGDPELHHLAPVIRIEKLVRHKP